MVLEISAGEPLFTYTPPPPEKILSVAVTLLPAITLFEIVALLLIPANYPLWLSVVLKRLGDTLAPLALLSVGPTSLVIVRSRAVNV